MAGQTWALAAEGGFFANPKLSRKLRDAAQPLQKFRAMARPESGLGKSQGDTFDFNKLSNVQTEGGAIGESQKMPETKFLLRRAQMTIAEKGNSIPWTGKLELLSEFDLKNPIQRAIRNDMAKVLDKAVATEAKLTKMTYSPTGEAVGVFSTVGAISAAGSNFNVFHLRQIVDRAIEDYVPPATGGDDGEYVLVGTQKLLRGLLDDPDFQSWKQYTTDKPLLRGELGMIERTRVVVTTNTGALTKVPTSTKILGEGVFFGDDAIIEVIAQPEEVRAKVPDDFGRSKGIAWYYLGGFKLPWDPGVDLTDNISGGEWRALYISGT